MRPYLDEEQTRNPWLTILWTGAALYAGIIVLLLFIAVGDLKEQAAGRVDMALGPLNLFHIQKVAEHGGNFSLQFSLSGGLAIVCVACFLVAAFVIAIKNMHGHRKSKLS